METTQKLERRVDRRIDSNLPSQLLIRENNGTTNKTFEGFIKDISTGGVMFESSKLDSSPHLLTKIVTLIINDISSSLKNAVNLVCIIVWIGSNGGKDPQRKLGLKFLEVSPEDKEEIKNYIVNRLGGKKELLEISGVDKKRFFFEKTVFLTDTNLMGNVYFSRYFEWQGMAREDFFRKYGPPNMINSGIKFITLDAHVEYKREVYLFDKIVIEVRIENLKKTSYEVVFYYFKDDTRELVAKGRQKICFADSFGKIIPVPKEIAENEMMRFFLDGIKSEEAE